MNRRRHELTLHYYQIASGLWLSSIAARMEYLMATPESDAARQELASLQTALTTFITNHTASVATATQAAQDAADNKQALVDVTAGMAQLVQNIAAAG